MNEVTMSEDRREMTVVNGGYKATLRSMSPDGFTDENVETARHYDMKPGRIVDGEVRRVWLRHPFGRPATFSVNTGPPTWWLPKVEITGGHVMVGWLRGLVAIKWGDSS